MALLEMLALGDRQIEAGQVQPAGQVVVQLRGVIRWVSEGQALTLSSVAWAEFPCGPVGSADRELAVRLVEHRQDFTPDHAVIAARLFNASGRRRSLIVDCMIGATALADGATVATSNERRFSRFAAAGLKMA